MSEVAGSGFLARWSRRKAAARDGIAQPGLPPAPPAEAARPAALAPLPATASTPTAAATAETAPPMPPPPTLDEAASLTPDSDFRRFVAPEVDASVKNAALKKLFADPHFNVMDGLDVYIDDYGKPDPLPAGMLARLAHSVFVGAGASPTAPATHPSDVAENAQAPRPPAAEAILPTDEDPAVRLQPDDAAGPDGDRPHAVDHARRER